MTDVAIKVENLHKLYRLGLKDDENDTLMQTALSWIKAPKKNLANLRKLTTMDLNATDDPDVLHALNDISFEVKRGEVLGIIGRNGAGKSTLLKILSRITDPTAGRVTINGRVASLLEVGTGFHPELTGRENIYMNGTILGMGKREIDRKFDEIVDFSGVERFLDTPVKRYSSGMKVRLAFAVAAHLEPEILIIDEVLAVGDTEFQKKCLGKMQNVSSQGRTVLFVSHNLAAVENLCSNCIVLKNGKIEYLGAVKSGIESYLTQFRSNQKNVKDLSTIDRANGLEKVFKSIDLFDLNGKAIDSVSAGGPLKVTVSYDYHREIEDARFGFIFENNQGRRLFFVQTGLHSEPLGNISQHGEISCLIPKVQLVPGKYFITVGCSSRNKQLDKLEAVVGFNVVESNYLGKGKLPQRTHGDFLIDARLEY